MNARNEFPLCWPEGLPRAAEHLPPKERWHMSAAVWALKDSLGLFAKETGLPVTDLVISSNVSIGVARPSDPGVAVYFNWDGAERCIAVDRYRLPEANVRSIYKVIEARRAELKVCGLDHVRAAMLGTLVQEVEDEAARAS